MSIKKLQLALGHLYLPNQYQLRKKSQLSKKKNCLRVNKWDQITSDQFTSKHDQVENEPDRILFHAGLFPAILGKGPWQELGKMIDLTAKLGEINGIEHNKGSKIYPQN